MHVLLAGPDLQAEQTWRAQGAQVAVLPTPWPDLWTPDTRALHPAAGRLTPAALRFLVRDRALFADHPIGLCLGWPDRSKPGWGGTGHTMRVARHLGVPVHDWSDPAVQGRYQTRISVR